jgi:hemolysin activation/secretion protein
VHSLITKASIAILCCYGLATNFCSANTQDPFLLQQERERQQREQNEPKPDVRTPLEVSSSGYFSLNESPCFTINELIINGIDNKLQLSDIALDWLKKRPLQ